MRSLITYYIEITEKSSNRNPKISEDTTYNDTFPDLWPDAPADDYASQ